MSKKTEVTVGRKTYALTETQAQALMSGVFRFERDGLYSQKQGGRKRPYVGRLHSSSLRSLHDMGLTDSDWGRFAQITPTGVRVARKLWPMFNDETMEELIARLNADDAARERERKDKLQTAVRGFKGLKDADGRSVAKRIREDAGDGGWNDRLKLNLDDLAAIGEQIEDRLVAAHEEAHR